MNLEKNNPLFEKNQISFMALLLVFCFPLFTFIIYFFTKISYTALNIVYLFISIIYLSTQFILWLINNKNKKETIISFFKKPELVLLLSFLVWMTISCFFSINKSVAFLGVNSDGFMFEEGLVQFYAYACVFYFAYNLKDDKWQVRLLKIFSILTFIIALLCFIDPNGNIFPAFLNSYPYSAMFINSNHYGYFLCLAILINVGLALFEKNTLQKILFALNSTFLIIQILFNSSFGPALAVFITLLLLPFTYKIFKQKWNLYTIIPVTIFLISAIFINNAKFYNDFYLTILQILSIIGFDVLPQNNSSSFGTGRFGLWLYSFELIAKYPVFGIGLGNFTMNGVQNRPHNEYIQYMVNTGIIGGLLYLAALTTIVVKSIKKRKETSDTSFIIGGAILCYLISAFFGNTMPHVMPFFVAFLGMYIQNLNK